MKLGRAGRWIVPILVFGLLAGVAVAIYFAENIRLPDTHETPPSPTAQPGDTTTSKAPEPSARATPIPQVQGPPSAEEQTQQTLVKHLESHTTGYRDLAASPLPGRDQYPAFERRMDQVVSEYLRNTDYSRRFVESYAQVTAKQSHQEAIQELTRDRSETQKIYAGVKEQFLDFMDRAGEPEKRTPETNDFIEKHKHDMIFQLMNFRLRLALNELAADHARPKRGKN